MSVFLVEFEQAFFGNSRKKKNVEEIFSTMTAAEDYVIREFPSAALVHVTDHSRILTVVVDQAIMTIIITEREVLD